MTADIDEWLQSSVRSALLAEEFPPHQTSHQLCRQGAGVLGLPGETWPRRQREKMVAILSIYTPELPYVPGFLRGFSYWAFFIERDRYEQSQSDGSLVIRRYLEGASLDPLPASETQTVELRFREVTDYPSPIAIREVLAAQPGLRELYDRRAQELSDRYTCHTGIKLGGYPHLIQTTAFLATLEPDFQIQIDATDVYTYADPGLGYLYGGLSAVIWESM